MQRNTSIKLKAGFLLIIFSLNSIIGFACAAGMDMGFNSTHHHDNEVTDAVVHVHKDGKKHVHHEKKESHKHDKTHHHDKADNDASKDKNDKGSCCNDKVTKFEQLDKSFPNSLNAIHPIFFAAFLSSFYKVVLLHHSDVIIDNKYFVRSYHPPIPNIRIAIQSFQI